MFNQEALSNVDPHDSKVAKMLSNAVALLDQKEILSQQNIRDKKEILNIIRRLTIVPKLNPLKINELLTLILGKVQNFLHLRAVCSHWKEVIESMCSKKKCLKLYSFVEDNPMATLSNRFMGTLKLEQFFKLELKYICDAFDSGYNSLTENFCTFLGQIFPNIDQLIVDLELDKNALTNLNNMLEKYWPNLNTVALNHISDLDLNTFRSDKLKRLDVGYLKVPPTPELIAQLKHFSCGNSIYKLDKMPQLGPNCTSFYWHSVPRDEFGRWIQHNSAQVLANITHLGIFWLQESDQTLIPLICENFPALQVLSLKCIDKFCIMNSATCAQLAKLSHLSTLSISAILFDLDLLETPEIKTRLSSIRVLNLIHFSANATIDPFKDDYSDFDGDRFCRILSSIVPNIRKFGIFPISEIIHIRIRDNLKHFEKFLKFKKLRSRKDTFYY